MQHFNRTNENETQTNQLAIVNNNKKKNKKTNAFTSKENECIKIYIVQRRIKMQIELHNNNSDM